MNRFQQLPRKALYWILVTLVVLSYSNVDAIISTVLLNQNIEKQSNIAKADYDGENTS